ncbi:ABC transporter permease [Candidatus Phyllobacterium onerii]|uniref:ABC transporter permease n=1 Tax=Candidatus Phyllobacterium onerii TaxID=3020828 RepID=UPI002330AAA4|nr:ABC transporter permease [Phyllobacterium sp. IY22]
MALSRRFLPFVLPLALLILWQAGVSTLQPGPRTPTPGSVVSTAWSLISTGQLPLAMILSLGRVLTGFVSAAVCAILIGFLMAVSPSIGRNLDPLMESFRPIAPIALLPLAILWFGTGTSAAAFIVGYAAFFPILINTIQGVRSIDPSLPRAARTLGVGLPAIIRNVILPGALPNIFVGARLGLGLAWSSIIAAELAVGAKTGDAGSGGIGQMMFVFYAYSVDLSGIIVCMIAVGVVALVIDRGLRAVEKRLLPWKQ